MVLNARQPTTDNSVLTPLVCKVDEGGVTGFVVIDSTIQGRSIGGLRMLPDVEEDEMRGLARAMTLKFGFLGFPQGGAKAGLRADPTAPQAERYEKLAAFGRAIAPLLRHRIYLPHPDMGTDRAAIRHAVEAAGLRHPPRECQVTLSGYFTACSVHAGLLCALRRRSMDPTQCRVAIEGFGKVGMALGELVTSSGMRLVAISTQAGAIYAPEGLDFARLRQLVERHGHEVVLNYPEAQRIELSELHVLAVEAFCPCARHHSIHDLNAPHIQAQVVCPGANNPMTPGAERLLFERGVLCLPYFVTNCGGTLGGTMQFASIPRTRIEATISSFIDRELSEILSEAEQRSALPTEVAEPIALARHAAMRRQMKSEGPAPRLFRLGLEAYRRGFVPPHLMAALSGRYFQKKFGDTNES